jgi:serine/threonine-protein kinase
MILAFIFVLNICVVVVAGMAILPNRPNLTLSPAELAPLVQLIVFGVSAVLLWRRPPKSVVGLRRIEMLCVGFLMVGGLLFATREGMYHYLVRATDEESVDIRAAFVERYIFMNSLVWFIFITAYAALIPNTRRRAVIVIGTMAVAPLIAIALNAYWLRPLPYYRSNYVILMHSFFNTVAVTIGLVSSSRIEYYRRQATEARKLGQYVLKEKLGAGGMGEVYRAEHALLRRPCALKLIRPEKAGDPDTLRRFEREVQTTSTLTHPNTVQVFDYGHTADGTFYYVMEYLPGLTLEELVRRHGPLSPARAVHFLRQVCAALGEAHTRGLTHRDIKPGNVMVCERGGVLDFVKVLDFGLVRVTEDAADGTLTREGTVTGTPAYLSPEQAGGEGVIDALSDIYSVGALAYFLLTGQPPFAGRSPAKMLAAHLYETPAPLPADIPPDLAVVVMRCLAKAPVERWPDAASLETALAETSAPAWTAHDATAWWQRADRSDRDKSSALATATWAEPGM